MTANPSSSPPPVPDFETPLASDEMFARFDADGHLSRTFGSVTSNPSDARAWAALTDVRRVRLVPSAPATPRPTLGGYKIRIGEGGSVESEWIDDDAPTVEQWKVLEMKFCKQHGWTGDDLRAVAALLDSRSPATPADREGIEKALAMMLYAADRPTQLGDLAALVGVEFSVADQYRSALRIAAALRSPDAREGPCEHQWTGSTAAPGAASCAKCGAVSFPPDAVCPKCYACPKHATASPAHPPVAEVTPERVLRMESALEYIVNSGDPRWTDHCTAALRKEG